MKLQEFSVSKPIKHLDQVFESYFGAGLKLERLNHRQAQTMLSRVRSLLDEHQSSTARHWGERNPAYLKLVMMEQALHSHVAETMPAPTAPQTTQQAQQAAAKVKDPKLSAALKKSAAGQALNPEEQKLVAGAALMKAESKLRNAYRMLKESEVQQAQVVLAAQDMVDKMQGMLEDVSELQFKELPALVDSIKNQVGIDQATQFNADASAALSGLLQNIQGAKQQLDAALGVVTGQQMATPDLPGMGADAGAAVGDDLAADIDADVDMAAGDDLDAAAADAAADIDGDEAPAASLGRERR
jgi:hypothetical protein